MADTTDLADGEQADMKGSGAQPYVLKNTGGVYSCTCPAWRNQSTPIEQRTCKHLRKLRGDEAETLRVGTAAPVRKKNDEDAAEGPPLLLAEPWDGALDLAGWWMSEKLDGVRAYWDGAEFRSRQGNLYKAPEWFVAGLPKAPLDGELWIARKAFQKTVSIVRRHDQSEHWRDVRFLVFDAPQAEGAFEDRLAFLKDGFRQWANAHAALHEHVRCPDEAALRAELARVEALGGEGLMLREPGSKYVAGRSTTLLKVKSFLDAEAVVIGHEPGRGKHKGRLGALRAKLPDGTEFAVGTGFTDRERAAPPAVGATITFRYQELSDGGVPRFPSYVGVRADAPAVAAPAPPPAKPAAAKPAAPKPAPAAVVATPTSAGPRHFECTVGTANKFWKFAVAGAELTTWWGRIGTAGQSKAKPFPTPEKAQAAAAKLLQEKLAEGYVEVPG